MRLNRKFFNPIGSVVGLVIGLVISLAIGNFWMGLGIGAVIAYLISPIYEDKVKIAKIRDLYWLTLAIAIPIFIIGAVAIALLAL